MSLTPWDEKVRLFLQKAGEDLKKVSHDVRTEAERLIADVKDPQTQQKVKTQLKDVGDWARKAAEEMADLVEQGVKKAEQAITGAKGVSAPPSPPRAAAPAAPAPVAEPASETKPRTAKKSIGGKKGHSRASPAGGKKKTIGKKSPPVR